MNSNCDRWKKTCSTLESLSWLPPLLARITLAVVFVESGWGKLQAIPKVVGFFTSLGIPIPEFMAYLVAFSEFGCGLLILFGLVTRLAAIPLVITMIVAILTAKKDDLHSFSDLTGFTEYLYIILLIWLIVKGAGLISADEFISRRCEKTSNVPS